MNMLKSLSLLPLIALLVGCATNRFVANGPIDATISTQSASIKSIAASNMCFNVYLVNSHYYAILPKINTARGLIDEINSALIFSDDQLTAFRKTCQQIIDSYDNPPKEGLNLIEYHLVSNRPEMAGSESGFIYNGMIASTATLREINRVVFRLQFTAQPKSLLQSGKTILYMFGWKEGEISIDDLKSLLDDLEKT